MPPSSPLPRRLARILVLFLALAGALPPAGPPAAEPYDFVAHHRVDVPLAIEQTTTTGTSVFVSGDGALLGNDALSRSVRLSPAAYPVWAATVSLPRGATLGYGYYTRDDAAGSLPSDANGTLVGTTQTLTTDAPLSDEPVRLSVHVPVGAARVVVRDVGGAIVATHTPRASGPTWTVFDVPRVPDATFRLENAGGVALSGDMPLRFGRSYLVGIQGGGVEARDYPFDGLLSTRSIVTSHSITSTILGNTRTLRVYLPRGYNTFPSRTYPVLYMHDGQNIFRPGGPFGTWAIEDALDAAIASGAIPQIIVVGIDNTNNRLREYMPPYTSYQGQAGIGDQYARFVVEEVIPYVEARYRVANSPAGRGIAGSSLGGLISMYIGWEHPGVFGRVASLSGSFWLDEIVGVVGAGPRRNLRVYLDSGNSNQDGSTTGNPDSIWDTAAMRDTLLGLGYVLGRDLHHTVGYGDRHNEAAWARRSPGMLRAVFPLDEYTRRAGDVNGNGLFEVGDLVALVNLKNGGAEAPTSPHAAAYADMQGDGLIDAADAALAADALLGLGAP